MAAVILLAGDERVVTPTGRILIHEVAAGTRGQTRDMEIQLWHIQALEDRLYKIISENTGLSMKDVRTLCKADVFYGAEDSLRLGFIDIIAPGKPEKRAEPGTRAVPPELLPENLPSEYAKKRAEERAPKAKPAESTPAPAPTLQ